MTTQLKPPYLEKIGERGKLSIWVVDGMYVRQHLDEEFTNSGQHFRFNVIPEFEIWLDKEHDPDERKFIIDEALIEFKLMKEGESYDKAETIANLYQKTERAKTKDEILILNNGKADPAKVHLKKLGETKTKLSIWIVDGRLVRSDFFIDFTEGGHDLVYKFVPKNEVWLDDDLSMAELPFVLIHELHERELMATGLTYHQAHAKASALEWKARNGIKDAKVVLNELGLEWPAR